MKRNAAPTSSIQNSQRSRQQYKPVIPLSGFNSQSAPDDSIANVDISIDNSQPFRRFTVVYARASNRKHKRWEDDGILTCQGTSLLLETSENDRKRVAASFNNNKVEMDNLGSGTMMCIGGFELEIQNEIYEPKIVECAIMCVASNLQNLIYERIQDPITLDEHMYNDFCNRLCSHPAVLHIRLTQLKALNPKSIPISKILEEYPDTYSSTSCYVDESGKLQTLLKLVNMLDDENQHAIIVSSSTNSLDIIETVFNAAAFEVFRLDGKTTLTKDAQIKYFNTIEIDGDQKKVLLMHADTKIGGKQSIKEATNLILFDVECWTKDIQDRIWTDTRVECQVYRLVTSNSFEEQAFRAANLENEINVVDIDDFNEDEIVDETLVA